MYTSVLVHVDNINLSGEHFNRYTCLEQFEDTIWEFSAML